MNYTFKCVVILLIGTLVLMASGILLYLNNHMYAAFWLVVVLFVLAYVLFSRIIRKDYQDEDFKNATQLLCAFLYTAVVTVSTIYVCIHFSNKIDNEAGVVYVLGQVSDRKRTIVYGKSQYLEFEATIKVPTFGLGGRDTIVYDYYGRNPDLSAQFPISGDYVLMQYSVAWPDNISYNKLNDEIILPLDKLKLKMEYPDTNITLDEVFSTSFSKYKSPVVVTPDGNELEGHEAMDYIREYIKSNE